MIKTQERSQRGGNSGEEQKTDLGRYKEKVIDRIYDIDATKDEVIKEIMGDTYSLFYDKMKEVMDNNLRMLKKAVALFRQIEKYIAGKKDEFNQDCFEKIMNDDERKCRMYLCLCAVVGVLTDKFSYVTSPEPEHEKINNDVRVSIIPSGFPNFSALISAILSIYLEEYPDPLITYYSTSSLGTSNIATECDEIKLSEIMRYVRYERNRRHS